MSSAPAHAGTGLELGARARELALGIALDALGAIRVATARRAGSQ